MAHKHEKDVIIDHLLGKMYRTHADHPKRSLEAIVQDQLRGKDIHVLLREIAGADDFKFRLLGAPHRSTASDWITTVVTSYYVCRLERLVERNEH